MKVVYKTVEEHLYREDIGAYASYGIEAVCGEKRVAYVSDISPDIRLTTHLSFLCNALELDPIHLLDVAEDAIAE